MPIDVPVALQRLHELATAPAYQSTGAAGMDLCACLPGGAVSLLPGDVAKIPTGLAIALPEGFEAQVRPRSGLASKHRVTVINAPGTIDSDYRGEVLVALVNLGREPFVVEHAMRIAQLVVAPVARATWSVRTELDPTTRGQGGFGSTGLA